MNENPSASNWALPRGEKWHDQLTGMEAMLAPVDEPLIHALHLDAPYKIADIACGGGGTTLQILRRAPAGSVVHGFDISPALIELARDRARPDGRIVFEIADVATAPAPESPTTGWSRASASCSLTIRPSPLPTWAWLAPGGRFAFAVWARPAENPWMASVREVAAEIIDLPPPDPEAPGPFRYADADKLFALLTRAGFGELDVADWRGAIPIGGGLPAAEAASFAIEAFSSFGELLAEAGAQALNDARQSLPPRFPGINTRLLSDSMRASISSPARVWDSPF